MKDISGMSFCTHQTNTECILYEYLQLNAEVIKLWVFLAYSKFMSLKSKFFTIKLTHKMVVTLFSRLLHIYFHH